MPFKPSLQNLVTIMGLNSDIHVFSFILKDNPFDWLNSNGNCVWIFCVKGYVQNSNKTARLEFGFWSGRVALRENPFRTISFSLHFIIFIIILICPDLINLIYFNLKIFIMDIKTHSSFLPLFISQTTSKT